MILNNKPSSHLSDPKSEDRVLVDLGNNPERENLSIAGNPLRKLHTRWSARTVRIQSSRPGSIL